MTNEPPEFGRVGLWTSALHTVSTARAQELAVEVEELGYGAVWLPEVAGRDVTVHLTLLLSATGAPAGATGIAGIWARDALAMTAAANSLAKAFPRWALRVSFAALVTRLRSRSVRSARGCEAWPPPAHGVRTRTSAPRRNTDAEQSRTTVRTHAKAYSPVPAYRTLLSRAGFSDATRVREHLDAGADHVCVQPLPRSRGDVPTDQWRRPAPALTTLG
ncbi:hypothetical protein [Amycolatopsis saalfeldensis]|uniref:Luciferase-like monooxygenase n=1 Tax=Amycolatopsis saalfeldensis TaxID=394193 RepID=A0A1H8XX70_9PSEU|nr:hypothetical protein [Amycolatopsis saalfeldensis]SEP44650.1 hypothetical protein SAMN04489732_109272 [Amycolatopsis saalfeldensis]